VAVTSPGLADMPPVRTSLPVAALTAAPNMA